MIEWIQDSKDVTSHSMKYSLPYLAIHYYDGDPRREEEATNHKNELIVLKDAYIGENNHSLPKDPVQ